ncbi:MAG TPA: F0F1 ATP synthase subunit A [Candidatus Omnitrophota bacterium]|nr:F0F1 ATP synthase subunit A [Candidatus Omnitrophota bacterium]HPD85436.1 F0F1 ATP synthase subunit A [Candidatus Omnitrophota bacterium]HRZ04063.1 F0F1 ATP synthase subunit A [Candidatus Omnitrophota bacterium]
MSETGVSIPEFPNIVTILAKKFEGTPFSQSLYLWESLIFSLLVAGILTGIAFYASRNAKPIPGRLQSAVELLVGGMDDFICGILGPTGRRFTPFIGTLFIYILFMNLIGLIPFLKSPTADWSTTAALAICVFVYVQYTAFKELGILGYIDHLMGKPRGVMAFSVVLPLFMFAMHLMTELIKPLTLSLRLRSNVWGDDMLLATLANFGIPGIPLLFFSVLLVLIATTVQALVFSTLSTIYFALFLAHEE